MRTILFSLLLALPTLANAAPTSFQHQGRVMDSLGAPVDGAHDITFGLYDDASSTTPIWTETVSTTFDNGYFSTELGGATPLEPQDFFATDDLWVSMAIDGGAEVSRLKLHSVPYALSAAHASTADGLAPGASLDVASIMVAGTTIIDTDGTIDFSQITNAPITLTDLNCSTDDFAQWSGLDWACVAIDSQHDASDITSGTLDILRLPMGTGTGNAAYGDHTHTASALDALSCATDEVPKVNSAGAWVCAADTDELSGLSCATGEMPKIDGSGAWACSPDINTDTLSELTCAAGAVAKLNGSGTWICGLDESIANSDVLAGLTCATNEIAKLNGSGTWVCAADTDTDTHATWSTLQGIPSGFADGTDDGLTSEVDPTVNALAQATLACSSGQVAVVDPSGDWSCADADATNTDELAGLSCSAGQIALYDGSSWDCAERANYAYSRNFRDVRNTNTGWVDVAGRSVVLNVRNDNAVVQLTYQDSIGQHMVAHSTSCRWRLLMDGGQVGRLMWNHADVQSGWRIISHSQDWLMPGVAAGSHTFQLQVIRSSGASECLNGWSNATQENFMLAREL